MNNEERSEKVKELKKDWKKAISEGNIEKAVSFLRQQGLSKAAKKSGRQTSEGVVLSYIHGGGKIGVMLEVVGIPVGRTGKRNGTFRHLPELPDRFEMLRTVGEFRKMVGILRTLLSVV